MSTEISQPDRPATTFTVRTSADLVALAPISLGFVPEESVVMLSFGGGRACHARVDRPVVPEEVADVAGVLLAPARRHAVRQVAFLLYDTGPEERALAAELVDRFTEAGIDVIDVLAVRAGRWFAVLPGHDPSHYEGVPFDLDTHPLTAAAVLAGRVRRGSREEVRASIASDPEAVRATEATLALGSPGPTAPALLERLVARHVGEGTTCTVGELLGLAEALRLGTSRDRVWRLLRRANATAHVAFWSDVVRRLPDPLVAGPAGVLAMCAWVAGEGALAWCAVDRCASVAPDHPLVRLVGDLLEGAVAPHAWDEQVLGPPAGDPPGLDGAA